MSDALYERYKDALRRGHVAALRGRLDAALVAYGEAADIAPERALPHSSLGGVLARLGRRDEALGSYGRALERAPRDEASLTGRADLLAAMGRRVEAAQDLDTLAELQEAGGRVADACDTARRALQLAESKARRRLVEGLSARLREAPANEAAARALEPTLGILEAPTAETAATEPQPANALDVEGEPQAEDAEALATAPETEGPPADGAALTAEAESLLDAGDTAAARARLLAAARAHRAAGRSNAALDACYLALGIDAFDFELHVLLAELYVEQGWRAPAADKLLLLGRLVDLSVDQAGRDRICALASAHFADDERLTAMCA